MPCTLNDDVACPCIPTPSRQKVAIDVGVAFDRLRKVD